MNALPFASNRREQSAVCLFVCFVCLLFFFAKLYDAQFRSVSGVVAPPHPTPYALARRWRNMRNGRGFRPSFNAWSLSLGQLPQSVTWFSRITWMKNKKKRQFEHNMFPSQRFIPPPSQVKVKAWPKANWTWSKAHVAEVTEECRTDPTRMRFSCGALGSVTMLRGAISIISFPVIYPVS